MNDDAPYDPWAPHDPWGDDGRRWPGLRGDHRPVAQATPLCDVTPRCEDPQPAAPSRDSSVERRIEPGVLVLQLVTSDGVAVSDQGLVVTQPDSDFEQTATTDAQGSVTVQVPEAGSYDVRFDPYPPKLPSRPAEMTAEPAPWLPRDTDVVHVSTTRAARLVLTRPVCTEVIVDGWAQGSVVMRWGGMRPRLDATVATMRGALRMALQLGRSRTMCAAGHADPLGTDAANDAVATERANSVHLFTAGYLYLWAEHATAHATALDVQCALVACHTILGLGACTLDNKDAVAAALGEIRSRANAAAAEDGEAPRDDDAPFGVQDWRVVANLYDLDLAIFMGTDRAGLGEIRKLVTWTDAPTISFGERHPRPAAELADVVELPVLSHRRVSMLVFGKGDGAQVVVDGGGDEIYDGTYTRTIVPVPGEVMVQILVATPDREAIAKGRAWINVGDLGMAEYTAHADGVIRFMTLCGDKASVEAAFDDQGLGTMISASVEGDA